MIRNEIERVIVRIQRAIPTSVGYGRLLAIKAYQHRGDEHLWAVLIYRESTPQSGNHEQWIAWTWNDESCGLVYGEYRSSFQEGLDSFSRKDQRE